MIKIANSPLQDILQAIDTVTHLECDAVLIPAIAADNNAAFASEDDEGQQVICLNIATPYDKMLTALIQVAAGIASETMEQSQGEIFSMINREIEKQQESEGVEHE